MSTERLSSRDLTGFQEVINAQVAEMALHVAKAEDERIFNALIRKVYAQAMGACHEGGRVEVHMGSALLDYLRKQTTIPQEDAERSTIWGFPVIPAASTDPVHLSVHIVHTITL